MSGDQLDLDAIEDHANKTADQGAGSDPHVVLALVAEVRRLRAEATDLDKEAAMWQEQAAEWERIARLSRDAP